MQPDAFWHMTPWEVHVCIEARREEIEHMGMLVKALAWRTAALSRAKKMPPYDRYMRPSQAKPERTPEEVAEHREAWAQKREYWETLVNRLAAEGKLSVN